VAVNDLLSPSTITIESESCLHGVREHMPAVRGSPLTAVMIHVISASTSDYHSEVDTIGHDAKHLLAKRDMLVSQMAFSGVTSEPYVII
jgi:hypothetical protein